MIKADSQGFLIADKSLELGDLTAGIEGIRSDTSAILALLQKGDKAGLLRRQTVPNPNSKPSGAQPPSSLAQSTERASRAVVTPRMSAGTAAWERPRDERGRFIARTPTAEAVMPARVATPKPQAAPVNAPQTAPATPAAPVEAKPARAPRNATPTPAPTPAPAPASDLTPVTRAVNSLTRVQAAQAAQAAREARAEASAKNQGKDEAAAARAATQTRDARGRFGSGGASDSEGGEGGGVLAKLKGLFSRPAAPDMGDFDKVDPTIEASKEFGKLVSGPLTTVGNLGKAAVGKITGGGKDGAIPWYRRIFSELRLTREQQSDFGIAEQRTLKDIERKTGMGGEGGAAKVGMLGMLGGGLMKLLGGAGGGLMKMLGGALGGGGGLLKGLGRGAMGLGKGMLRRLPLLGALFAGGSALASIFGGDDPSKSAEENRKDRFTGAGSGIGALIGGGIGMLLGPVGAIVGGVLGDKIGELVGAWLATVDWSKVAATITGAWDSTVGFFKDSWKTVTDKLGEIGKTVSEAWKTVIDGAKAFLKDKFGIDVDAIAKKGGELVDAGKAKAAEVAKPVVDTVKAGADKAKEVGKAAVDYGKERVEKLAEPIQNAASNAADAVKGWFGGGSKGNKAALMQGMVNAGISDPKEQAMFMAQMDHESGGFRSMEEGTKYKPKQFLKLFGARAGIKTEAEAQAILDQGPEATANAMYGGDWGRKNLGNTEAGDGAKFKGRGFTQLTGRANYTAAAQGTGLDLVNHPELAADPANAAKIATWYWQSKKGLADAGKSGDVLAATKKINGGTIGLDDRKEKYEKYLAQASKPGFAPDAKAVGGATALASTAPASPATAAASSAPASTPAPAAPAALASTTPTAPVATSAARPGIERAPAAAVVAAAPITVAPPPVVAAAAPPAPPRVSVASVSVPAASNAPPAAQASIPVPMNSAGPMEVRVANDQAVGQDLKDRRLAAIATGGIAA
jgi:predicted chitinase